MIEEGILIEDKLGRITIKSLGSIYILRNLYYNDFLSYWKFSKKIQNKIDGLIGEGLLFVESSLLSKPEEDYFSYYFNNEKFINAPALGNHYRHGSIPKLGDEKVHEYNYFKILKLVVLAIIKINDDIDIYTKLTR